MDAAANIQHNQAQTTKQQEHSDTCVHRLNVCEHSARPPIEVPHEQSTELDRKPASNIIDANQYTNQ